MLYGAVSPDGWAEPSGAMRRPSLDVRSRRLRLAQALLALVLLMAFAVTAAPEDARAGQAGTINTEGVALMAGLDDQTVIDWLPAGARVDIFWGPDNDRYQVRYYETVGWVWAEFLSPDGGGGGGGDTGSSGPPAGGGSWAVVNTGTLNVRADASSDAAVWDSFHSGDWVQVTGDGVNGFVPIDYYGSTAWVAADFLSWDGTVSTAAPEAAAPQVERWIDVNSSNGLVTLFEGDAVYATYWAALGFDRSADGFYATAVGTYYVYSKHQPLAYTAWANAFITDWVAFDPDRSNGFHSYTRDANGNVLWNGGGPTGGCVALPPDQARVVYDFASIGMRVVVHQ